MYSGFWARLSRPVSPVRCFRKGGPLVGGKCRIHPKAGTQQGFPSRRSLIAQVLGGWVVNASFSPTGDPDIQGTKVFYQMITPPVEALGERSGAAHGRGLAEWNFAPRGFRDSKMSIGIASLCVKLRDLVLTTLGGARVLLENGMYRQSCLYPDSQWRTLFSLFWRRFPFKISN